MARYVLYPNVDDLSFHVYNIKYDKRLSYIAKLILKSFKNKYLYHAIDDLGGLLKSDPLECEYLLSILCSSVIGLQNNFCINFLDVWIHEIYINEIQSKNKFINSNFQKLQSVNYITIKLAYLASSSSQKMDLYSYKDKNFSKGIYLQTYIENIIKELKRNNLYK